MDPPPEQCEVCGASPVETVLFPVPVHFRGSGFYSTDYGRQKSGPSSGDSKDSSSSDSKKDSSSSDSKPDSKSKSKSKDTSSSGSSD
jgi:predicted nucleic acid-binding Zn ribbon protein